MIYYSDNDRISALELWTLMFVYIVGSALTIPVGYNANHDSWISVLIGTAGGLVINGIYAHLVFKYPSKTIVDIARLLVGSWFGKLVAFAYAWYSFYLATYVLRNFTDLTGAVLLPRTPTVVVGLIMIGLAIWTTFKGIEVIAKCSLVLIVLIISTTVVASLLLLPDMDFTNVLPVLESGWLPILQGAGGISTGTLGEPIVFAMLLSYVHETRVLRRTVLSVIGVSGAFLLLIYLVNIFVLGELTGQQLFPTYSSCMYIAVGDFFERIEPLIFTVWIFNEFAKLSICLLVAAQSLSLSQKTGGRSFRVYLLPVGLLILELSLFIHPNQLALSAFIREIWTLYSLPFLVVVPFLLLLVSWIRKNPSLPESSPVS